MANIIPTTIEEWSNGIQKSLEIDKIVDFTGLLKDNERSILFNPCITHYRDELYICCYRYRTYNVDISNFKEIAKNNYANPNHPWRSNWGRRFDDPLGLDNMTGAQSEIGKEDSTKFAMLRITYNNDIELVKKYEDYFNDINLEPALRNPAINNQWHMTADQYNNIIRNFNPLTNHINIIKNNHKYISLEDCRIVKTPDENKFFLIGNMWVNHTNLKYRENQHQFYNNGRQDCNNGRCAQIYIWPVRIDPSTLKLYLLSIEPIELCPEWASRIEKNWSLYVTRNRDNANIFDIKVTYQLTEKFNGHEWMELRFDTNNNTFSGCDNAVIHKNHINNEIRSTQQSISFFGLIEQIYNNTLELIKISSTTTTIEYNPNELLGVGHVKLHIQNSTHYQPNSIGQFMNLVSTQIGNLHYTYVYLFFFYTLSRDTKQLRRFSKFHIPSLSDVALIFPTGLTQLHNREEFCISFGGEGDNSCEALFVEKTQIEDSLLDINYHIFQNNNTYNQITRIPTIYSGDNNAHTDYIRNRINQLLIIPPYNDNCLFTFTRWNNNIIDKIVLI